MKRLVIVSFLMGFLVTGFTTAETGHWNMQNRSNPTNAPILADWVSITSSLDGTKLAAIENSTGNIWTSNDGGII